MKDAIGQDIEKGDFVAHAGLRGGASVNGPYEVVNVTEKRVTVLKSTHWQHKTDLVRVPLDPRTLINVTMNLQELQCVAARDSLKGTLNVKGTMTGRHTHANVSYVVEEDK